MGSQRVATAFEGRRRTRSEKLYPEPVRLGKHMLERVPI
jgi:hypothetical protein